ncbi:glycosyltransferase family 2 protein [Thermaerobacter subterraneus]|nr:glycosyltransferase [Thermaerobacter subterraneus]
MMHKMPTVSVLMTVYNGERYLPDALESLRNQTFRDFEVVIVDDGSTDRSREIIQSYIERDKRFRMICAQRVGRAAALNLGLRHCRGIFVAVNDADDISVNNRLEVQVEFLRSNPNVVLVGGWAELIDENGRILGRRCPPEGGWRIKSLLSLGNPIVHSTVMYRREILSLIGGFDETLSCAIDYDAIERCMRYGPVSCLPVIVARHRRHKGQYFRGSIAAQMRFRTAAKTAVRIAWNHATWMVPLSIMIYIGAFAPLSSPFMRVAQCIHTRMVHGRHAG